MSGVTTQTATYATRLQLSSRAKPDPLPTVKHGESEYISHDWLAAAPNRADVQVSPDGKYVSFVTPAKFVGSMAFWGPLGGPYHMLGTNRPICWVGEHTLLFSDMSSNNSLRRLDPSGERGVVQLVAGDSSDKNSDMAVDFVRELPDRRQIILKIASNGKTFSPWVYSLETGQLRSIVDNTSYDSIIVNEDAQPVYAHRGSGADLQVFVPNGANWREIAHPPSLVEIVGVDRGQVHAIAKFGEKLEPVEWYPSDNRVERVLPETATSAVVDSSRVKLLAYKTSTWHASDAHLAPLMTEFNRLGVSSAFFVSRNYWVIGIQTKTVDELYLLNTQSGQCEPLFAWRSSLLPSMMDSSLFDQNAKASVFEAKGIPRGVVLFSPAISQQQHKRRWIELLVSRGYVVVSNVDVVSESGLNNVRKMWPQLPIACVGVMGCRNVAAIVNDYPNGKDPTMRIIDDMQIEPESLEQVDATLAQEEGPDIVAVIPDSMRVLTPEYDVVWFALVESFLAQHLGGMAQPFPVDVARFAGAYVRSGDPSNFRVLKEHPEIRRSTLNAKTRALLTDAYERLQVKVTSLFTKEVCTKPNVLAKELKALTLDAVFEAAFSSWETRVLSTQLWKSLDQVLAALHCQDTSAIEAAVGENLRARLYY